MIAPPDDCAPARCGLRDSAVVGGELHLVLNNTIAAIEDGRVEILRFVAPHALGATAINRLEVIFEELVSNIVRHGFAPRSDQAIAVRLSVAPGDLTLTLEDDGAPFDPMTFPIPTSAPALGTARLGGLGIPLVRRLAAQLRYERPAATNQPFVPVNRVVVAIATA